MRLKAQDRRAQLLDAAMHLFSTQGFDGTTTQQIAREAGVNEAIIFRHFRSKEELYWAVVTSRVQAIGRRRKIREHIKTGRNERETLASIAGSLLDRTKDDAALTRLLFFSALRNQKLADRFFRTYMTGTFQVLAGYFRKQMRSGRFRRMNPVLAARGFLGMVIYHYLVQEVFGGERYQRFDPYEVGQELADLWLEGMLANPHSLPAHNGANGHGKPARARQFRATANMAEHQILIGKTTKRAAQNGSSRGSTH